MSERQLLPTFRDPAGSLTLQENAAIRSVRPPFDLPLQEFLRSSQAKHLVDAGSLVASEICGEDPLTLKHPRIPFVSYPWEWPSSMWRAAANRTLELCLDLLQHGRVLRDATPLNILFWGTQPMLVDLLSVGTADPQERVWMAYSQFVRTFTLPMLANAVLGWPFSATISRRDGYEPEDLWPYLSATQRLQSTALSAVTLPTLLHRKQSSSTKLVSRSTDPDLARYSVERAIRGLQKRLDALPTAKRRAHWAQYAGCCTHYEDKDKLVKREFVASVVKDVHPARVLDVGCNTGEYSLLAAEHGAGYVVGIDADEEALNHMVDRLAQTPHARRVTAVQANLARPTPRTGWKNQESFSLLERCERSFDLLMMLAVLHHLLLREQIPMREIVQLCASITRRDLIIEWVPSTDPMFAALMLGREEIYGGLTESAFLEAFHQQFTVVSSRVLGNGRTLFHMRLHGEDFLDADGNRALPQAVR